MGIKEISLSLFQSYLSDRYQDVQVLHMCTFQLWRVTRVNSRSNPVQHLYYTHCWHFKRTLRIEFHVYADDHQLNLAFNKTKCCIADVQQWIVQNMLKFNEDKTYFIDIGTRQYWRNNTMRHIYSNGSDIESTSTDCNLDVMFDSEMSIKVHASLPSIL